MSQDFYHVVLDAFEARENERTLIVIMVYGSFGTFISTHSGINYVSHSATPPSPLPRCAHRVLPPSASAVLPSSHRATAQRAER